MVSNENLFWRGSGSCMWMGLCKKDTPYSFWKSCCGMMHLILLGGIKMLRNTSISRSQKSRSADRKTEGRQTEGSITQTGTRRQYYRHSAVTVPTELGKSKLFQAQRWYHFNTNSKSHFGLLELRIVKKSKILKTTQFCNAVILLIAVKAIYRARMVPTKWQLSRLEAEVNAEVS